MSMLIVWLLAMGTGVEACTCSQSVYRPACEAFWERDVVFLGKVTADQERNGKKYAVVQVDEIYRGLTAGTKEVLLEREDPCGGKFQVGKQYLILTNRPFRDGWPYPADFCSGTREAVHAAEDLAWLREMGKRPSPTRVYGTILQDREWRVQRPVRDDDVVLSEATVTLSGERRQYVTRSKADGRYEFAGIPPGHYEISSQKAPWISSPHAEFVLREGGCAMRNLSLKANGRVEGRVVDALGRPGAGLQVELVRRHGDGLLSSNPTLSAVTDRDGAFVLSPVPVGMYVVGVHIVSGPPKGSPFSATYYPGEFDPARAYLLPISLHRAISGLTLWLLPPLVR